MTHQEPEELTLDKLTKTFDNLKKEVGSSDTFYVDIDRVIASAKQEERERIKKEVEGMKDEIGLMQLRNATLNQVIKIIEDVK